MHPIAESNARQSAFYAENDRTIDAGPPEEPIDGWLRFENDTAEEPDAEANTYVTPDGYRVEWYLTAVGLVTSREFYTLEDAYGWLVDQGFADYTP